LSAVQTPTPTSGSWPSTVYRWAFGEPALVPLSIALAFAAIADAFVAVSLADSLFFNLSPDASRRQVLIYLIITVAPLAVLAPLIGPAVDRFRTRQRLLASICFALRAVFCVALASSLFQLSFYGFALALLVIGKASGIIRQALVPLLVHDPNQLVAANARLVRLISAAGATGGAIGVVLLRTIEAPWLLRAAAGVFILAAIAALKIRPSAPPTPVLSEVEYAELHLPTVVVGSIGVMAIRAAVGFFVFTLAFTLRRESEPVWVYGAAIVAYSGGAFIGTTVAPALRRRFQDAQLIAIAIAAPALPVVFGILGVSRPLLLAIAALIGVSTTLGRAGFDSLLQHRAPVAFRARTVARYETRFQLVWALGAVIATPITLPAEASMAVLAAVYLPALAVYLRASNAAKLFEQRTLDVFGRAEMRLVSAEESLVGGAYRVAIIDAAAAVDLARLEDSELGRKDGAADLELLRIVALDKDAEIDRESGARAVAIAESLLSSVRPRSPKSRRTYFPSG
jgi:MFS family permease